MLFITKRNAVRVLEPGEPSLPRHPEGAALADPSSALRGQSLPGGVKINLGKRHARDSTVEGSDQGLKGFARDRTLRDRNAQASERVLHAFRGNALHLLAPRKIRLSFVVVPSASSLALENLSPQKFSSAMY